MPPAGQRVRVEEADWSGLLPWTRLFRSFRMAIHPAKLLTALLLVVLVYLVGTIMDAVRSPVVYPGELMEYATADSPEEFATRQRELESESQRQLRSRLFGATRTDVDINALIANDDRYPRAIAEVNRYYRWRREMIEAVRPEDDEARRDQQRQLDEFRRARRERVQAIRDVEPGGVFETALRYEVDAFQRLIGAATTLNLGTGEILRGLPHDRSTVVGALRDMFVIVPGWLWHAHRWFLLVFAVIAIALWSLLGGAIARMAALQATRDQRVSGTQGVRFALGRWGWFAGAPFIPVLVALLLLLILFLFGFLFFGIPYVHVALDVVGGLLFVIPILLGLAVGLILIGLAVSVNLLYPAIAVEGTDAFDANSRAYSYVLGRPWHLLFYNLVALVYGALTYLFMGLVIFLALLIAQKFVSLGAGVFMDSPTGGSRFDDIVPPPEFGELSYRPETTNLNTTGVIAAHLAKVWVYLFVALLAAYAISFYFCAQTWIYLLLRRSTDATEFDEVQLDPPPAESAAAPPEKIEPQMNTDEKN
jgi:hypothetical protein